MEVHASLAGAYSIHAYLIGNARGYTVVVDEFLARRTSLSALFFEQSLASRALTLASNVNHSLSTVQSTNSIHSS